MPTANINIQSGGGTGEARIEPGAVCVIGIVRHPSLVEPERGQDPAGPGGHRWSAFTDLHLHKRRTAFQAVLSIGLSSQSAPTAYSSRRSDSDSSSVALLRLLTALICRVTASSTCVFVASPAL